MSIVPNSYTPLMSGAVCLHRSVIGGEQPENIGRTNICLVSIPVVGLKGGRSCNLGSKPPLREVWLERDLRRLSTFCERWILL